MVRAGHRFGLVDQPTERKIHRAPTPHIGGLAVYLGFVGSVLINSILADWMMAILFAGSLLLVIGLVVDVQELPAWFKLVAQVVGAGLVISTGKVLTLFPAGSLGELVNFLLTLIWIVGITNAFNFFDGMDGLATGLAILIAFFLGIVAFQTNQPDLGRVAVALVGASLGFLANKFKPNASA